jgi:hypothetical protein
METELTIEYGKNLMTRKVIHQELLCCHSQKAQDLYKKAKIQREAYSSANEMRKKLKEYTAPYMSEKAFEEQHIEKLVRVPCLAHYTRLLENSNRSYPKLRAYTISIL